MTEENLVAKAKIIYFECVKEYINGLELPPTAYELNEKHREAKLKMYRWYHANSALKTSSDKLESESLLLYKWFQKHNKAGRKKSSIISELGA